MSKKYKDMTPDEQSDFSHEQWHWVIDEIPDLIEILKQGERIPDYEMQKLQALCQIAQVYVLNMVLGRIPDMRVMDLGSLMGGPPEEPPMH